MANFLKSLFVKGIEIDPDGATSAQVLSYNGTKFVPVTNTATATTSATDLTSGTLDNARLPASATTITTVGTLGSLAVSGNLTVDTDTLVVDATNNRVGIGTASPLSKLHIADASGYGVRVSTATNLGLIGSNGESDGLRISGGIPDQVTVGGNIYLYGNTHATRAADVALMSNGNEILTVDGTTLRVGIGVLSPTTALDVSGTVTATAFAGAWNGTAIAGLYGGTGVANSGKTITLGGNLTTSGAFTTTLTVTANTSVTLPTTGTLATLAGTETLTNKTLTTPALGVATGTSFTGTASNHQNNFVKLSASANDSTTMWGYTGGAAAYANLRTYCAYDVGVSWISNGTASPSGFTPNAHAVFMAGTTISGDIRSGAINTTTYSTSSDYRLKENITEINDAMERIRRLRPVSFQFKDPNNDIVYDGFLAHEVQEVISYAASGIKDAVTADGEIMPQMIDMSTMVGLLTAGIKELDARLAQLESI